jgi:hypothetical protein
MDSLQQQPDTPQEDLRKARALLNLFVVTNGQIPEEEYAIAISTLRDLLIAARHKILDDDLKEYARILAILSDEPLKQLRNKSTLDDVQDTVTYLLDHADFGQITEDLYAEAIKKKLEAK